MKPVIQELCDERPPCDVRPLQQILALVVIYYNAVVRHGKLYTDDSDWYQGHWELQSIIAD